jgi:acetylornithine deacetylase/succinyl-diaminopimelate desuccinylase-like protein
VSPSAATGNTDTKWYWGLTTRNIYRFVPRRAGTTYGQHTVNEGILLKSHLEAIAWYHELVLFADEVEGDEEF